MLRILVLIVLLLALAAMIFRRPGLRRALWAALVVIAAYGVLKATGVVDAIAPSRTGVF